MCNTSPLYVQKRKVTILSRQQLYRIIKYTNISEYCLKPTFHRDMEFFSIVKRTQHVNAARTETIATNGRAKLEQVRIYYYTIFRNDRLLAIIRLRHTLLSIRTTPRPRQQWRYLACVRVPPPAPFSTCTAFSLNVLVLRVSLLRPLKYHSLFTNTHTYV